MFDFYDDVPRTAEPSYEELLAEKEKEIADTWSLVRDEAECDYEDADTDKMMKLIMDLRVLDEERVNLIERIDARDEWRCSCGSI